MELLKVTKEFIPVRGRTQDVMIYDALGLFISEIEHDIVEQRIRDIEEPRTIHAGAGMTC